MSKIDTEARPEFDINRDFFLPVILKLGDDLAQTNSSLQHNNYWIGYREGFELGVEEGTRRARRDMQYAIGIIDREDHPNMYSDDYKKYADGPVVASPLAAPAPKEKA